MSPSGTRWLLVQPPQPHDILLYVLFTVPCARTVGALSRAAAVASGAAIELLAELLQLVLLYWRLQMLMPSRRAASVRLLRVASRVSRM